MPVGALSQSSSRAKNALHLTLARQVVGLLWFALDIITTFSLISYDPGDLGFNVNPPNTSPSNAIGYFGAGIAWFLYVGFGFGAYLFCVIFAWACMINLFGLQIRWRWKPLLALLFIVSACCLLDLQQFAGMHWIQQRANIDSPGGLVGSLIIGFISPYAVGSVGAAVLFGTIFVISGIYLFNFNPILTALGAFSWYRSYTERREERRLAQAPPQERLALESRRIRKKMEELHRKAALEPLLEPIETGPARIRRPEDDERELLPEAELEPVINREPEPEEIEEPAPKPAKIARTPRARPQTIQPAEPISHEEYVLPGLSLLSAPTGNAREAGLSDAQLRKNLETIVETLRVFGVLVTSGEITPGATITRYEVYPGTGVRVDKIKSLGKDLARVLCAERINILAPIPGRDSVGIEVPNSNKVSVFLRELLESRDWAGTAARIPIALGKDVYGKTLVADLAAMPHLLIGGTTGSGKSVCINCILMSFLYRFSPDDLRLILIDPKQVEMQVYNSIPHLVVPVVTDPKKVMLALRWVINEMELRYRILAACGVRNIASFNARGPAPTPEKPAQMELAVTDDDEDGPDEIPDAPIRVPREDDLVIPAKLPYIVVIVDELADLMQTAPADVESAVARITAKARAAGIHLIVATQTPRREVVTGVIKTNIPARVAFQVPSGLDSRVILDENGAENLLGRGDLLYRPPGVGRLTRGQGAFVSDEEVQDVVSYCAKQGEAQFVEEIHNKLSGKAPADMEISEADRELIIEAFEVIRQEKRASTSNLQRRMRLGYNRAAYVIDYLEKIGVLAPGDGAKPREILVDLETYELNF